MICSVCSAGSGLRGPPPITIRPHPEERCAATRLEGQPASGLPESGRLEIAEVGDVRLRVAASCFETRRYAALLSMRPIEVEACFSLSTVSPDPVQNFLLRGA